MIFASSLLSAVPHLRHAFFSREGGVSKGIYESLNGGIGSNDNPADVIENRRRMAEHLGVGPAQFLTVFQIHSPDVAVATAPWGTETRPRADAMVTNVPGLALGVTAADCGPILFVDPEKRVIGAAHSGWKGAIGGVLENTIAAMESLGASRGSIIVWGSAESSHPGELSAEQRLKRLDKYHADFGGFDKPHGPYLIDIRHWQEISRRPLGPLSHATRR